MSELERGTTRDVFWSNVESLMRGGTTRADAVKLAAARLRADCADAGVDVPEPDRMDEKDLLPEADIELELDDSGFNALTRQFLRDNK